MLSTHTTELQHFLRTRRSVRRFRPERVPEGVIREVLTTATLAPSAHNRQPWRFVVLRDAATRTRLAEAMALDFRRDLERDGLPAEKIQAQLQRSRERITSAPVAILLCLDMTDMDIYPDASRNEAEYRMAAQSVAAAGLQLLLAAHAEGLGGVWACWPLFAQATIRNVLELPPAWEPQAMLFLGYPVETPAARTRKPVSELTLYR